MPKSIQQQEPELANQPKLAALDLGSNSFHLVIARLVEGDLQILSRHKERVRLAAGLNQQLELSDAAMQRGLDNLRRCNERLQDIPKQNVRIVATHTLRVCRNRAQFLSQAQQLLAHPIEVISGHEEARLIFQAVAHTEQLSGRALVVDIGGGSTELAIGNGFEVEQLSSRTMGCVSYTQQFFAQEISQQAFKRAILAASHALEPIARIYRKQGWEQAFATSGTASALASAAKQFSGSSAITLDALIKIQEHMIKAGSAANCQLEGVNENRLPVLAGGTAIMIAIMQSLQLSQLQYSDAALREGVLYEMDDAMRHQDIRLRTRRSLQARYKVDREQATRVKQSLSQLYQQLHDAWQLPTGSLELLLDAAALHEIGLNINTVAVHKHSSYILEHVDMPGIRQEEQAVIAMLVRFYRKKLPAEELIAIGDYDANILLRLIRILRLAVILNISRSPSGLQIPEVEVTAEQMQLTFTPGYLAEQQLLNADLQREAAYLSALGLQLAFT